MSKIEWAVGQRVAVLSRHVPLQRVVLKVTAHHVIIGKTGNDPKIGDKYRHNGCRVGGSAWDTTSIVPWTEAHTIIRRQAQAKREARDLAERLVEYARDTDASSVRDDVIDLMRQAVALLGS